MEKDLSRKPSKTKQLVKTSNISKLSGEMSPRQGLEKRLRKSVTLQPIIVKSQIIRETIKSGKNIVGRKTKEYRKNTTNPISSDKQATWIEKTEGEEVCEEVKTSTFQAHTETAINVNKCYLCQKSRDNYSNSIICEQCRMTHNKCPKKFKFISGFLILGLVIIIGVITYLYIEEKIENNDLNDKYDNLQEHCKSNELIVETVTKPNEISRISSVKNDIKSSESILLALHKKLTNTLESISPLNSFLSMTESGIYIWTFTKSESTPRGEYISREVGSTKCEQHRKGIMTNEGYYVIAGGYWGDVRIYKVENLNIEYIKSFSSENKSKMEFCFQAEITYVICLSYSGYIYKYNTENNIISENIFGYISEGKLSTGTESNNGDLVFGSYSGGILHIIREGEYLGRYIYNSQKPTLGITQLKENILLTADHSEGCFIHIYLSATSYSSTKILSASLTSYWSIIALQISPFHFGVGGTSSRRGFIHLYRLSEDDDLRATLLRKKEGMEGDNCCILALRELTPGIILFGGSSGCQQICTWKYAVEGEYPICWDDLTFASIYDFMPI